jgi:two-component system, chemotaxis family, sensor kinase CheA
MQDQEILTEFLAESAENLSRLDQEIVKLETNPTDQTLLGSIFRTIHTIKGTCGFLGFPRLEAIAHVTENILNELRNGVRSFDRPLATLILASVDAIRRILSAIEAGGEEGPEFELDLLRTLKKAQENPPAGPALPAEPLAALSDAQVCDHCVHRTPCAGIPGTPIHDNARQEEGCMDFSPRPEAAAVEAKTGAAAGAPAPATPTAAAQTLRIDVNLLDRLMNLVGELVLTRNQILQFTAEHEEPTLNAVSQRLNLITSELQERVMKTRMQPVGQIFNKAPRIVRDLAAALGKEIQLEISGAETELDRTLVEAIKDPFTHIVRNSCDHGIESPAARERAGKPRTGTLSLKAFHEGGQVNIEISDDGAGIDPHRVRAKAVERGMMSAERAASLSDREAVDLVFAPGFSTAAAVTNVSGRGVGMDVVRTHVEAIGGTVEISSRSGEGTTLLVKIPLTLAIIPGLVVTAGGERFVVPQISLHELIRLEGDAARSGIEHVHSTPVLRRRDVLLPLADLSDTLQLGKIRNPEEINIAVLQVEQERFGLIVDAICDTQEIVVKPLWQHLKPLNCYAGAAIMGDGGVGLILDVAGIGARAGVVAVAGQRRETTEAIHAAQSAEEPASLLLVKAGDFGRLAFPLSRVSRLERIPAAKIEYAAGRPVVQYRERMLPLISVGEMLNGRGNETSEDWQTVVCRNAGADVGLVVDEILDIVEDRILTPHPASHSGLLGSAVVGGQVTDFLDLDAMMQPPPADESLARLGAALRGVEAVLPAEVLA